MKKISNAKSKRTSKVVATPRTYKTVARVAPERKMLPLMVSPEYKTAIHEFARSGGETVTGLVSRLVRTDAEARGVTLPPHALRTNRVPINA